MFPSADSAIHSPTVPGADGPGVLLALHPEVRLARLEDVHLLLQQTEVVRGRRGLQRLLPIRHIAQVVPYLLQPLLQSKNKFKVSGKCTEMVNMYSAPIA